MFFHLRRLLMVDAQQAAGQAADAGQGQEPATSGFAEVAVALEQFLQTSTLGEFERRLEMVPSLSVTINLYNHAGSLLYLSCHSCFYHFFYPILYMHFSLSFLPLPPGARHYAGTRTDRFTRELSLRPSSSPKRRCNPQVCAALRARVHTQTQVYTGGHGLTRTGACSGCKGG